MEKPYSPQDDYDDENIPEIDLPRTTDTIPAMIPGKMPGVVPDDVPRRDGPGGE